MQFLPTCLFIVLAIGSSAATSIPPSDPNATLVPSVSLCHSLCKYDLLYGACPWGAWIGKPGYDCNPGFCRLVLKGLCYPLSPSTATTVAPETTTVAPETTTVAPETTTVAPAPTT